MIRDLTQGKPAPVLLRFSMPMFFSMLFQQLYNLADSLIAGRFISEEALGAIGTCYPVTVIFIAVASGLSLGANTAVARVYGGKAWKEVGEFIPTAVWFAAGLSLAVMAAGLGACPLFMKILHLSGGLGEMCGEYLEIYILGMPFLFLYNMAGGIFQALGDSKTPWRFLAAASVINVLLDLLFVIVFQMGVPGTAWATLAAQGFSAAGSVLVLRRTYKNQILPNIPGENSRKRFCVGKVKEILKLGIPSVCQQVFISLGQMSLQSVINPYGTGAMAGYSAAFRINTLFVTTTMTLSNALSSFVSQNLGARKMDRVTAGVRAALWMAEGITLLIVIVCLGFREPLIRSFLADPSPEAVKAGSLFLSVVSPFFPVCCLKNTMDGTLRGMGAMRAFLAATFADILVRIFLGRPFSRLFGLEGVFWVWPGAWILGTALSLGFYLYRRRRMKESFSSLDNFSANE